MFLLFLFIIIVNFSGSNETYSNGLLKNIILRNSNSLEKASEKNTSQVLITSKTADNVSLTPEKIIKAKNLKKLDVSTPYAKNTTLETHTLIVNQTQRTHILLRIHATITRSKDAVWATITLTFLCVLLVIAVAQSRMWKNYHATESQGVPLPNFNEKVLFRDVMEHRMKTLKQFFKKKKKSVSEMELLLPASEWDNDEV